MLTKHGVGTAIVEGDQKEIVVDPKKMLALLFWPACLLLFGINAISFSKVSWFITLIRLVTKRWQKVVLWALMLFSTLLMLVASTFGFYQCHFEPDGSTGKKKGCLNNDFAIIFSLATSIYSTVLVGSPMTQPPDIPIPQLPLFVLTEVFPSRNLHWRLSPPTSCGTCLSKRAPRLASSVPRAWPSCECLSLPLPWVNYLDGTWTEC